MTLGSEQSYFMIRVDRSVWIAVTPPKAPSLPSVARVSPAPTAPPGAASLLTLRATHRDCFPRDRLGRKWSHSSDPIRLSNRHLCSVIPQGIWISCAVSSADILELQVDVESSSLFRNPPPYLDQLCSFVGRHPGASG